MRPGFLPLLKPFCVPEGDVVCRGVAGECMTVGENTKMTWVVVVLIGVVIVAIAARRLRGASSNRIAAEELQKLLAQDGKVVLLDVRTPGEYSAAHIPGAVSTPHGGLPASLGELTPQSEQPVVVYCEHGPRASLARRKLLKAGFTNVLHLEGDMSAWRRRGLPVESGGASD